MRFAYDPWRGWGNVMQLSMVMAESQMVITMRLMGMAGFWSVTPHETTRMVTEKVHAATKAWTDASVKAVRGGSSEAIAAAAIAPVRRATRANRRRLSKRGMR